MARIPEMEIEKLKTETDIISLITGYGVQLKPSGENFIGHCPFHDDKTPSLIVTPSKGLWHCMGACNEGGSVIDWVMKKDRVGFRHAFELLKTGSKKLTCPVSIESSDEQSKIEVIDYYHETLLNSPEALSYLEKRGIKDLDVIQKFKIGYADRSLGQRLPARNCKEGNLLRDKLIGTGILRSSGHEHYWGSVTIPIFNEDGNVVQIYGRKIRDDLKEGTVYHSYLASPLCGVWNYESLIGKSEVILCESLIDAITFYVNGFKNVTTSYGVNGFTESHLTFFKNHGISRVYIAYDRDEAGDKAASELSKKLITHEIESLRVLFPKGMDANEYTIKVKPGSSSLLVSLQSAEWIHRVSGSKDVADIVTEKPEQLEPKKQSENVEVTGDDVMISFDRRKYRIRGFFKNGSSDALKVNIRVSEDDLKFHVDTLDLYQAKQRVCFINSVAAELAIESDTIKRELGRVLCRLEELQSEGSVNTGHTKKEVFISESEREEAIAYLQSPRLLDQIKEDFKRCGVVGEDVNMIVGYLASISRKLEDPIAVLIQSSSAAGKSSLMEAVLSFVPDEDKVKFSAMTGQSLFYLGETDLKNKVLAIAEDEGVLKATYALKLLQSEGEISIASTGKDAQTGKLVTHEYKVRGPVQIFLTTTKPEVDEELLNRCIVLTVDENREQTRAIHEEQRFRQTLEGLMNRRERLKIIKLHQNAQRLLRPLSVVNPLAKELTFIDTKTRTRRDHGKFLTLIKTVTLLHQYQRKIKSIEYMGEMIEYVEATAFDVELATMLTQKILNRSMDELSPQSRTLLALINEMVKSIETERGIKRAEVRFTRKNVREFTGWSDFQLQVHMQKLRSLEYLLIHRGGRGQFFEYELLFINLELLPEMTMSFLQNARSLMPSNSVDNGSLLAQQN